MIHHGAPRAGHLPEIPQHDAMNICPRCTLPSCACRTGKTTVTAAGATPDEAKAVADAYLGRRGWQGELISVRRRRTRLGILGYQAWDLRYRVTRP